MANAWHCLSPDDSKIAVLLDSQYTWYSVVIVNASTGATTDSIPLSGSPTSQWYLSEWSRTGLNSLLLTKQSDAHIYYLTPTSGSTPIQGIACGGVDPNGIPISPLGATWSPNNSSIMFPYSTQPYSGKCGCYPYTEALQKVTPFTTNATTVQSSFESKMPYASARFHWHQ